MFVIIYSNLYLFLAKIKGILKYVIKTVFHSEGISIFNFFPLISILKLCFVFLLSSEIPKAFFPSFQMLGSLAFVFSPLTISWKTVAVHSNIIATWPYWAFNGGSSFFLNTLKYCLFSGNLKSFLVYVWVWGCLFVYGSVLPRVKEMASLSVLTFPSDVLKFLLSPFETKGKHRQLYNPVFQAVRK